MQVFRNQRAAYNRIAYTALKYRGFSAPNFLQRVLEIKNFLQEETYWELIQ